MLSSVHFSPKFKFRQDTIDKNKESANAFYKPQATSHKPQATSHKPELISGDRLKPVPITIAVLVVLLSMNTLPVQAEGAAVSQLNAKIEGIGGAIDGDATGAVAGSIAIPLGQSFGAQLDAMGGTVDGDGLIGYGGHFFWRDPAQGLIGGTIARSGLGGDYINRYGGEGEYYADQWTLGISGGTQTGFLGGTWYGSIGARYYINDNLMIDLSGSGFSDNRSAQIGFEWQPHSGLGSGLSLTLFAVGGIGSDDLDYGLAGVKLYFGAGDKSLKRRHREDDPINPLIGVVTTTGAAYSAKSSGGESVVKSVVVPACTNPLGCGFGN